MTSIIIPFYQDTEYIFDALKCIFSHLKNKFEVIIINDGSPDNINGFLGEFVGKVKIINQLHSGVSSARNNGIKNSTGEYIAFLDADDLWLPAKLTKSLKFLQENNFDWVCTAYYRTSDVNNLKQEDERKLSIEFYDGESKKINLFHSGIFFFSSIFIHTSALLVRRECFKRAGLFNEELRIGEDWDLLLRFEENGLAGGYLDEPLSVYRVNNRSLTRQNKIYGLQQHISIARHHAKILGFKNTLVRKSFSDFLWRSADILFSYGDYFTSFKCLTESIRLNPDIKKLKKILRIKKAIEVKL